MTTISRFHTVIMICMVVFLWGCSGGGGISGPSLPEKTETAPEEEKVHLACNIADFSDSIIDESVRTEKLSVTYSVKFSNSFKNLEAKAYIIPTPIVTDMELNADVYDRLSIGEFDVKDNIAQAKIDLTYHWDEKELVAKMTHNKMTQDRRYSLDGEFQHPALLIVGVTQDPNAQTEFPPHRTWSVAELPLKKF